MTSDELWFDHPADSWLAALPLGNGHIGVMAHGGVDVEHLQVNDATAWSGSPRSEQAGTPVDAETAAAAISGARDAVAAEDFDEAARLLKSLQHRHSQSYLPYVDLRIASAVTGAASMEATDYRRSLDLASASYSLRYRVGGFEVRRQPFVSHPHDVGVVTIDTDCPAGLDLSIALSSLLRVTGSGSTPDDAWMTLRLPTDVSPTHDECEEPVIYSGEPGASMEGAIALSWTHDGQAGVSGTAATGVHAATIVFSTRTTFAGIAQPPQGSAGEVLAKARGRVSAAFEEGIDCVRTSQRADHAELYDRVHISTGPPPSVDLPTDERLRQGNAGADGALSIDPALAGLLYSFGRYLLISSSRPGGVPANLQGIWNDRLQPPWSGNYTTNINVEMNYWPAEVANLSELGVLAPCRTLAGPPPLGTPAVRGRRRLCPSSLAADPFLRRVLPPLARRAPGRQPRHGPVDITRERLCAAGRPRRIGPRPAGSRRDDCGVACRPSAARARAPSSLAPLLRLSG